MVGVVLGLEGIVVVVVVVVVEGVVSIAIHSLSGSVFKSSGNSN